MQVVLSWLPGYFWDGHRLRSTGSALPPTQHMDKETGEIMYYVRPIFTHGATVGLFLKHKGVLEAVKAGKY